MRNEREQRGGTIVGQVRNDDDGLVWGGTSWDGKEKKKCPVKFLELFSCHSLYLTTGQIGTQIYLMKSVIIHHMFIEHTQTLY